MDERKLTVDDLMMAAFSGEIINGMLIVDVQVEVAPEQLPAPRPDIIQRVEDGMLITFKVKRIGYNIPLQGEGDRSHANDTH